MKDGQSKLEKRLLRILLVLGIIAVAGIVLLIRYDREELLEEQEILGEEDDPGETWEEGLSDATFWLPEGVELYGEVPEFSVSDQDGTMHSITEWKGKPAVLIFWASWCQDCKKQMEQMSGFMDLAAKYGEIPFLFINKTDGKKETVETAESYFSSLNLPVQGYYDLSQESYEALGIKNTPTTIFMNEKGQAGAWSSKPIESEGVFEALLKNATEGSRKATASFVQQEMTDSVGGIHSSYDTGGKNSSEVLSESQGLMLLYAAKTNDRNLFDKTLTYIKQYMWQDGLASWKVKNKTASNVNALIDDFRIYRGLKAAAELWGGYEEELKLCKTALNKYGTDGKRYVDFYDFENKKAASRFTLCYADLEAMKLLSVENTTLKKAYLSADEILNNGQISNEFPLYYSWYNYDKKRYEKDDLNAAEAMMTLLHLARQGRLKNNTVKWLKEKMAGDGVKSRYTVEGEVVPGYEQDSTAVYAIIVMIAQELQDEELKGRALKKMEKMHITDISLPYNGAFGQEDGTGITSFDQLMPLMAYAEIEVSD